MQTRYAVFVFLVLADAASAQAPLTPETAPGQDVPAPTTDCAAAPRGSTTPDEATTGQASEPLGDKLAKSNGVLCPPTDVDPAMRAPTPKSGDTTPVIPPPGSPGGDPNLRPK